MADDTNSVTNVDAVGLGESSLYEAYFVCITISGQRTLIEYGKSKGTRDTGNVYLNMIDKNRGFQPRFYGFLNKNDAAKIMDAHIVSRKRTQITCKGNTVKDAKENLCGQGCHRTCDPFEGRVLCKGLLKSSDNVSSEIRDKGYRYLVLISIDFDNLFHGFLFTLCLV